jgi:hypothetical protein
LDGGPSINNKQNWIIQWTIQRWFKLKILNASLNNYSNSKSPLSRIRTKYSRTEVVLDKPETKSMG